MTAAPVVVARDEQDDEPVDLDRWSALAHDVLAAEGVLGEVNLLFVGEEAMAALNEEHLGHEGPTDVLSFPIDGADADADGFVGDVVVCPAVARRNAPGHAGTYDDELALLVVHGLLHLLGHDHAEADEAAVMRERERFHLARCGS